MWRTWWTILSTGTPPEGARLDGVSRWLLATRAEVLTMTITSVLIGGLLARPQEPRQWFYLALTLVGVTLAHASNNMLNDYFDYKAGLDTPDYARVQYAVHPIVSGLMSERTLLRGAVVVTLIEGAIALYLTWVRGPLVLLFAVLGLLISIFYTAEPIRLKKIGLGELAVLIVWGPLMTGGTYLVTTGELPWWVWPATLPFALIVTTVLMGKHIDKLQMDAERGIRTVPVLLGERGARRFTQLLLLLFYPLVIAMVLIPAPTPWGRILPLWTLLILLSIPRLVRVFKAYNRPKPGAPPEGYPIWPLWFVAWAFLLTRITGLTFLLGLILGWVWPLPL